MVDPDVSAWAGSVRGAGSTVSIVLIVAAQVAAMALWFSDFPVAPALKAEVGFDELVASLLTSAVQIGFVVGTLASAQRSRGEMGQFPRPLVLVNRKKCSPVSPSNLMPGAVSSACFGGARALASSSSNGVKASLA